MLHIYVVLFVKAVLQYCNVFFCLFFFFWCHLHYYMYGG